MAEPRQSKPAAASDDGDSAPADLGSLREKIDAVDDAILARLNERARLVQDVGRLKQSQGAAVFAAGRERHIVERLVAGNPGPFPAPGLAPVFREIISATRSLEDALRVGYLGPEATFTHLAANRQFGQLADLTGFASIAEIFEALEKDEVGLGVVPAENTTEGIVTPTLDAFVDFEGTICGEILLRISYHLLSRSGRREEVRRIVSHPQTLGQCRRWLDRNLPGVERIETASTAAAARQAAEDGDLAAIGSAIAGEVYGLETVDRAIEDRRDNTTRFLVIGRQATAPSGNDLTSAYFTLRKDESGGLHRLLEPFAERGVNLTSIQIRPIPGKPWEYLFFIDLEGHASEPQVTAALEAAAAVANSHRVLGSFPRANPPMGRG